MEPRRPFVVLSALALLSASPAWAQVRVQTPVEVAPAVGGQAGAAGTVSPGVSKTGLDLKAPSLVPTLNAPLTPVISPSNKSGGAILPAKTGAVVPVSGSLDLPRPAILPAKPGGTKSKVPAKNAGIGQGREEKTGARESEGEVKTDEASVQQGRAAFDGAAPKKGVFQGLWDGLKDWVTKPDLAPAFPGAQGGMGRIKGKKYRIGRKAAEYSHSVLFDSDFAGHSNVGVRLFKPGAEAEFEAELAALNEMKRDGLNHAQVIAVDRTNLVIVQLSRVQEPLNGVVGKGPLRKSQAGGLMDTAARLIRAGRTVRLAEDNLFWDHWYTRWNVVRARGYEQGGAWDVLSQLWGDGLPARAGFEEVEFLRGLRARLSPESAAWRQVLKEAAGVAELKRALEALARLDAARPPSPKLSFESMDPDPILDDSIMTPRQIRKRLGYDPLTVKKAYKLHMDDEGKLNTELREIHPEGGTPLVVKHASPDIIQRELFLRKVVRRYFAAYFDTPGSLVFLKDDYMSSYMVMQQVTGSKSWARVELPPANRVALAILIHTFGVWDMNPGNVFYNGDRTSLIDFEQALSRHEPVPNRLGSTGLIDELPWVKDADDIEAEDFSEGIRQWRELFAEPGTQAELERMLTESGFEKDEIAHFLAVFRLNVGDLHWTILTDVDYAKAEDRPRFP